MPVYFLTPGLIELESIYTMGVSVKTKENPIGYFGTGLKFAIATLLRTGHKITLVRGAKTYEFSTKEFEMRGQTFNKVFMNEEPLSFTTDLGKNWEVWQAYRELHANTLDENGVITNSLLTECGEAETCIIVEGSAILLEYNERDKIFVSGTPITKNRYLEVYEGGTTAVYYRGVRAGFLGKQLKFTYNILKPMTLTEDRTFSSQYDVEYALQKFIPTLNHKEFHMELLEETEYFDQGLNFSWCSSPSDEFLAAAESQYANTNSNSYVKKVLDKHRHEKAEFTSALLSDKEKDKFLEAFQYLQKLSCSLSPEDVDIVETLGPGCLGIYHTGKDRIFLAKSTLDTGMETLVSTLYEEWLHAIYKYNDCTRELQNFLFQRLTFLAMNKEFKHEEPANNTIPF